MNKIVKFSSDQLQGIAGKSNVEEGYSVFFKIDRSTQKLTTGKIPYFDIRHSLFDIRYSLFSEFLFRLDFPLSQPQRKSVLVR